MNKKVFKKIAVGVTGLGAMGGVTAAVVACGATTPTYDYKVYYSDFINDKTNYSRDSKALIVWIPFADSTDNTQYPVKTALENLLKANKYSIAKTVGDPEANYSNALGTLDVSLKNDNSTLPDIIINYPDLQGVLAEKDLAQEFDKATADAVISPAIKFDVYSVLSPKAAGAEEKAFALPFIKSTELTYYNVPAFAMLLNDIAARKASDPTATTNFPAGSPQARMAKMIMQAKDATTLKVENVYDDQTNVNYSWSELKSAWDKLSAASTGLWKDDASVLKTNFNLTKAAALDSIDLSKPIFDAYDTVSEYVKALSQAYTFPTDYGILGVDSSTNVVYSYQYDVAGHSQDNFLIRKDFTDGKTRIAYDYSANFNEKATDAKPTISSPSSTQKAFTFYSDLVGTKALLVNDIRARSPLRMTRALGVNQLFMAWESNSGTARPFSKVQDANAAELNPGQVYYDLQPTKAALTETKSSIINQGPSIYVTKANANSADIAKIIADGFKPGGAFVAHIDPSSLVDSGMLAKTGYIYPDAIDHLPNSLYRDSLAKSVASSDNWATSIGKYLLSNYYAKGGDYDTFANPAGRGTTIARTSTEFQFIPQIVNKTTPNPATVIQNILRTLIPDARLN